MDRRIAVVATRRHLAQRPACDKGPRVACPRSLALALILGLGAVAAPARAVGPADEAGAERLFQEAKGLMAEGRVPEACSKLAEAKRLEVGGGIILALAVCHAKEGRNQRRR